MQNKHVRYPWSTHGVLNFTRLHRSTIIGQLLSNGRKTKAMSVRNCYILQALSMDTINPANKFSNNYSTLGNTYSTADSKLKICESVL
jgi:hypothetical protein